MEGMGLESFEFTKHSNQTVEGVDDAADFKITLDAMKVVGFKDNEILDIMRVISAILYMGNLGASLKKESPNSDQAEITDTALVQKICFILGIPSADDFKKRILRPIIGFEGTEKQQTVEQTRNAIEALARTMYDRMFERIVTRINESMDATDGARNFIGVLDISGFEIFEKNSFEQLCINYTNEKLQQFFNHRMFVLEQEEYKKEQIEWKQMDFGLDLQPTIDLIEQDVSGSVGVLAKLNDACANSRDDATFTRELNATWKGKSKQFLANPKKQEQNPNFMGFTIGHYAGNVTYNTTGWVQKVRDPLNENITRMLARSSVPYIALLWADYANEEGVSATVSKVRALRRTVAVKHKENLAKLMEKLYRTRPNFVRCIIPNETKTPGKVSPLLVLDQLRCNGVLEGIRIVRQGFPNRITFESFRQRFEILEPDAVPAGFVDNKKACIEILKKLAMDSGLYRVGLNKIFFKAGQLAYLEELRDRKLGDIIAGFQARLRGYLYRSVHNRKSQKSQAIKLIQRNMRIYLQLKDWPWYRMVNKLIPLCDVARSDKEMRKAQDELRKVQTQVEALEAEIRRLKEENAKLHSEIRTLHNQKSELEATLAMYVQNETKSKEQHDRMQEDLKTLESELNASEQRLKDAKKKAADEKATLEQELQNLTAKRGEVQQQFNVKKADAERLEESLASLQRQTDSRIGELETQLSNVGKSSSTLGSENAKLRDDIKNLEASLRDVKAQVESTQGKLRDAEAKNRQYASDLQDLVNAKANLEQEQAKRKTEFAREVAAKGTLQSQLEANVRDLTEKLDESERRIQGLTGKISTLEQDKRQAEQDYQALQQTKGDLAAKDIAFKKVQTDIAQLNARIADKETELAQVIAERSAKVSQLEEQLRNGEQQRQSNDRAKTAEIARLQDEVDRLKSESSKRVSRLQGELDQRIIDLQLHLEEAQRQAETEKQANADKAAQIKRLEEERANVNRSASNQQQTLEKQIADLREKNEELKATHKKEIDRRQSEYEEHIQELDSQRTSIQQMLQAQISGADQKHSTELASRDAEVKKLRADLVESQAAADLNSKNYQSASADLRRLTTELEDRVKEADDAKKQAMEANRKSKATEKALNDVKLQLELVTMNSESTINDLKAKLDSAKKDGTDSQRAIADLKAAKSALEQDIEAIKANTAKAGAIQELERERKRLDQQLTELKAAFEDEETRREAAENRAKQLQSEFDTQRRKLDMSLKEETEKGDFLRSEMQVVNETLNSQLDKNKAQTKEMARLREQLERLTLEASSVSSKDVDSIKKKLEAEKQALEKRFDSEKEQLSQLWVTSQTQANSLKNENEALVRQAEQNQKKADIRVKELSDEIEELRRLNQAVSDSKQAHDKQLRELRQQLEEQETRMHDMTDSRKEGISNLEYLRLKAELTGRISQLEDANRGLQSAQAVREQQLEERASELEKATNAKRALQDRIDSLEQEVASTEQRSSSRTEDYRRQLAKAKEDAKRVDDLMEQIFALQEDLKAVKADAVRAKGEAQEAETAKSTFEGQVVTLKKQLRSTEDQLSDVSKARRSQEDARADLEKRVKTLSADFAEQESQLSKTRVELDRLRKESSFSSDSQVRALEERTATLEKLKVSLPQPSRLTFRRNRSRTKSRS